ncbi:MAG TPA: tetratricopeptide repeat protein [Deltaproteobacteria bacterium]|nr:tetratricopeptide repeat protein [Deltaproteobacteria bacterium]HOI05814.1 tetratricopeptide repeat protein [Deltaproteobacteria bacterium]
MGRKGNAILIVILVIAMGLTLFLLVPMGGEVGAIREAMISFMFRTPPRFISMDVSVDGIPRTIGAGETLKVTGKETIVITRVRANTFFPAYLTADVVGFGKDDDLREPIDTAQVRRQLMDAGIRAVPIEISYIDRTITKVPLEIDLDEKDFLDRITQAKDTDARIAALKSAHASFPRERKFVVMLDELLSSKNDYDTLAGIYRKLAEANPDDIDALTQLSRCYVKLGRLKEAMDVNQKIVDKGHGDAQTYRRMAMIAGEDGDFETRVGYLKKALGLEPNSEPIVTDLGKTYEQAGMNDRALELYKSYAGRAKGKDILVPVIQDAVKGRRYDEAATLLKRYVALYPQDRNAFAQLAYVMGKLGKTDAQTDYYTRAVDLNPKDPVLLYNLAVSYEKAGNDKGALDTYRKVLKIRPGDRDTLLRAAPLSLKTGDYRASYDLYHALIKAAPSNEARKGLVSAAVGMKEPDRIIEASREYLKNAQDHDVAITLAYAYETRAQGKKGKGRLDDLSAALDAYRLALKINPNSHKAQEKIPELKIETIKLRKGT